MIADKGQVLTILKYYITEFYGRSNRPGNVEFEPEEEVDADEKRPYILCSEVKNAIRDMKDNNSTGDDDVLPGEVLTLVIEDAS